MSDLKRLTNDRKAADKKEERKHQKKYREVPDNGGDDDEAESMEADSTTKIANGGGQASTGGGIDTQCEEWRQGLDMLQNNEMRKFTVYERRFKATYTRRWGIQPTATTWAIWNPASFLQLPHRATGAWVTWGRSKHFRQFAEAATALRMGAPGFNNWSYPNATTYHRKMYPYVRYDNMSVKMMRPQFLINELQTVSGTSTITTGMFGFRQQKVRVITAPMDQYHNWGIFSHGNMAEVRKLCAANQRLAEYGGNVLQLNPDQTFVYTMSVFQDSPNKMTDYDATKPPYEATFDANTQYLHRVVNGETPTGTTKRYDTARQWSFVPKFDEQQLAGFNEFPKIASFTTQNISQAGSLYDISDNTWQHHKVTGTPWLQNFYQGNSAEQSIIGASVTSTTETQKGLNYPIDPKSYTTFWYGEDRDLQMFHKKPTGGCSFYSYKSLTYNEWLDKNRDYVAAKQREGGNDPKHHDNFLICVEPVISTNGNVVEPELLLDIVYEWDVVLGMEAHDYEQGGDIFRLTDGPEQMKNYPYMRMGDNAVASFSMTSADDGNQLLPMF